MARRKDHTREELTQLTVESARELVSREGPAALTARNVAKLIGYTPGTLYNLFENIDELAAAINILSMEQFAQKLSSVLQKQKNPKKRIHQIAAAYLAFEEAETNLWKLLFATPVKSESEAYHVAVHLVFDQVEAAMLPISGSPLKARQDSKILWSTLHGICLLKQSQKLDVTEPDPPEKLVKRFLNKFLDQ